MDEPIVNGAGDQELEMDESAYEMYHRAQTNAPCLSFDIIDDDLGDSRTEYPHTCFLVSGTQADTATSNSVIVMKMSNLKKTLKESKEDKSDSDSDSDSDDEEDEDEKPDLEALLIKHNGCVNRIRSTTIGTTSKRLAASWSELGKVYIWDLSAPLMALTDQNLMSEYTRRNTQQLPLFQFDGHLNEGFALDWSPIAHGNLLSGDCTKNIHYWKPTETSWQVDQRPFVGHTASVEDLQWSPSESSVFASCSVDKSIRIWDIRAPPSKANMLTCDMAHTSDVNVINWNRLEPFIVSGGDDGVIKVWDLRVFQQQKPVGILKHHTKPITSIEWNRHDSTVFAACGEDDMLTIWDLAIEKDDNDNDLTSQNKNSNDEEMKGEGEEEEDDLLKDLPPQLLFVHQGQKEMKELHWHRQIPGCIISTAHDGLNVFKTISV